MTVTLFTALFVVFVLAALAWRLWLGARQARHVVKHRDEVPPDFAALVPLDAHRKAADYTLDRQRVSMIEAVAIDAALLLALTVGGGLAAIDEASRRLLGDGTLRELATVYAVLGVGMLAMLPFDAWRTFVIEARYGFNRTTLPVFIADLFKGIAIAAALGIPLLLLVFWFVRAAGNLWWLYTWIAWIAFTLLLVTIFPRWIAPLFNRFTPLEEGELRRRIQSLIERCGFRAEGLFVMDGSKRSSHGNAYFTGFGKTKRIVFFDTLMQRLTPQEIEAVLAHELGHFARGHIPRLLAVRFALALMLLALQGARLLPGPRPVGAAYRGGARGIRAAAARVHFPVPAVREPHRAPSGIRGRCVRRGACLGVGSRERARQALPRQRLHAHPGSAAFAGV